MSSPATSKTMIEPSAPPPPRELEREKRRNVDDKRGAPIWPWILVLIVAALIGYGVYVKKQSAAKQQGGPTAMDASKRSVPVLAVSAKAENLDLYLNGLGTVTPLNTVTVRTRVDGELVAVHFVEGQMVKQGELLAEIDPRPYQVQLAQGEGQLARDEAILQNAQADLERYQSAANAVSKQQIDQAEALVRQTQGVIETDKGQIASAQLNLTYCKVTSPLSGRIGLRNVDQGNIVHASDTGGLAVVTQLQPISVLFTIPQDQIARVIQKPDGGVGLAVEAWNRDLTRKIAAGAVAAVDNTVDPGSGTVRIKATFANQDNALFPNQFVNARLLVNTLEKATIVPAAAVQHGPNNLTFAYVVKGDQTVEMRNIVTGPTEGDRTAITQGVAPGDMVVTDGVDKLQNGSKVEVRQPGAATRPGKSSTRSTAAVATAAAEK